MTDSPDGAVPRDDLLRYAAERAMRAPSVHNTQPWQFVVHDGSSLDVRRDPSRRLGVLDPRGRQMTISCGCALLNARVALAALGYDAIVERLPEPSDADLIARITLTSERHNWLPLSKLDEAIDQRRTNRRAFLEDPVTDEIIYDLVRAAREEGGVLVPIRGAEQVAAVAELSRRADELETSDPNYLTEVQTWTSEDPRRTDGVQLASLPNRDAGVAIDDALPLRAFDSTGLGWLPSSSRSDVNQCLLLVTTEADTELGWIRAGEAIERVWLELTLRSYSASPVPQVIEVGATNAELRRALQLVTFPHLLLRVGHAADVEASKRRPVDDVVTEVH